MANSDQEGIEIGDEHIEMYEEVDVAPENGDDDDPQLLVEGEQAAAEVEDVQEGMEQPDKEVQKRSCSPSEHVMEEKEDFDDDELDSEVDESEEKDENAQDPEVEEHELLSMPQLRHVINDVGHLKEERRIMVHPLTIDEFNHPAVKSAVSKDTCEEVIVHFVRPKDSPHEWRGFLTMQFTSGAAGDETEEEFKAIREDLVVECEKKSGYPWTTVDNWARDEKGQKRWTDCLLYIKNVGENVTEDQLKEVFPDASHIVIPQLDKKKDGDNKPRFAYAVYRTSEFARFAAAEFASRHVELDGQVLRAFQYRIPVDGMPRGLLKLQERRVVLKYLEKLREKLESLGEDRTTPVWVTKRFNACMEIIERDNRLRQTHRLPTPELANLRLMHNITIVRGADRRELLMRLGVIDRPPRQPYRRDSSGRARSRERDHGSSNRHKSYGNSSRSTSKQEPKSLLGLPPPSLLTLPPSAVPMSLMMQNNLAFMSGMMSHRGMNMMSMGGSGSSNAGRSSSYRSRGGGDTGSSAEPSSKMLRLDASGNFHVDYNKDRRHQSSSSSRDDKSRSSKGGSRSDRK